MGYKLGKAKKLEAHAGNIKSKFTFKSSNEVVPGTPVYVKKLDDGVLAEANMDGSIFISQELEANDPILKQALAHEMQHVTAMKIGHETYDDNAVYYKGEVWPRGNGYITDPNTGKKYSEGDRNLPWEKNKV